MIAFKDTPSRCMSMYRHNEWQCGPQPQGPTANNCFSIILQIELISTFPAVVSFLSSVPSQSVQCFNVEEFFMEDGDLKLLEPSDRLQVLEVCDLYNYLLHIDTNLVLGLYLMDYFIRRNSSKQIWLHIPQYGHGWTISISLHYMLHAIIKIWDVYCSCRYTSLR